MNTSAKHTVAAIQMVSGASLQDNLDTAEREIAKAAAIGASLVLLPEYFCFMGMKDTDKLELAEPPGKGPIQDFLSGQARKHGLWVFGGTLPIESGDAARVCNALMVYDPEGVQIARYDKIHLFGFRTETEAYDESVTLKPGTARPVVVDTPLGRVGLSICYDLRFPELYRAMMPVHLLLVPAAFTHTTGSAHWEILLRARAIENQCYVLAAAQGGEHENGRRTWGHSMLIDPWGRVLAQQAEGAGVVAGELDAAVLKQVRDSLPAIDHRRMVG